MALPTNPHGPPHDAPQLVRHWWENMGRVSNQGLESDELPLVKSTLEDEGFVCNTWNHNASENHLTIDYDPPTGMSDDRALSVLLTAIKAGHYSGRWVNGGIDATTGTLSWTVRETHIRSQPFDLVKGALADLNS